MDEISRASESSFAQMKEVSQTDMLSAIDPAKKNEHQHTIRQSRTSRQGKRWGMAWHTGRCAMTVESQTILQLCATIVKRARIPRNLSTQWKS